MSIYVGATPILSWSEFIDLMDEMPGGFQDDTITDLFLGAPVSKEDASLALNVSARMAARSERAHDLIDLALARLDGFMQESSPDELHARVRMLEARIASMAEEAGSVTDTRGADYEE